MQAKESILEGFVNFKRELSLIAVRDTDNNHKYYEFLKGTTQLKLYVCCIVFSLTLKLTSNGR
jgi:phosphoribosylaminoimidazole carboxylase (NCAIR synthetase)